MSLSSRIKHIRDSFGINQEQLAEIFGTSVGVPKGLEQGTIKNIKPKYSILLSNALKINKEWIETGKGEMRIDENDVLLEDISTIANSLKNNSIKIKYYEDINASAGNGYINSEYENSYIQLVPNILPTKSKSVEAIRVYGDSMESTIKDKDIIFIDRASTNIINGKIYVVLVKDEVYVKRIFKHPNNKKLILKSDNPLYPQFEIELYEFTIIGLVVASMNMKDL